MLNKDTRTYGKQFLFDGTEETCWNSDEGESQFVIIKFEEVVNISEVGTNVLSSLNTNLLY